jgi:hypothetical protein
MVNYLIARRMTLKVAKNNKPFVLDARKIKTYTERHRVQINIGITVGHI